jgi:hypothetical protein
MPVGRFAQELDCAPAVVTFWMNGKRVPSAIPVVEDSTTVAPLIGRINLFQTARSLPSLLSG